LSGRNITYITTAEGWLYLAVIDLFNREVIGWSIKPRMTSMRTASRNAGNKT